MGFKRRELIKFLDGLMELVSEENKARTERYGHTLCQFYRFDLFPYIGK